ncbi:MAG: acetylglutamate kinase [Bacteroidales bacterium]|nr:acetylglutamate kinase [Bacteroidales bacterium]
MKINVVKIGGNVVEDGGLMESFAADFARLPGPKILVHGGGVLASSISKKLGIEPHMIQGRRVTDEETLRIVTMVYAGWCNKSVVALLHKHGCPAIGLSGADANVIEAVKRPPVESVDGEGNRTLTDYGFVGDLNADSVNASFLTELLSQGITPVICAITHDGHGTLLNTNADTIATEVAISMCAWCDEVSLTFCFEKNGVLFDRDDEGSVIPTLTPEDYAVLRRNGRVADGMIPKLDNAFRSIGEGVSEVVIKHSRNILNNIGTVLTAQ